MTRPLGYALVCVALLGALVSLVVVTPPSSGASLLEVLQEGTVIATYRDGNAEPAVDTGGVPDSEALDRFLQALRERSSAADSRVEVETRRATALRLTLGQSLIALTVVGLIGGALLAFGRRH